MQAMKWALLIALLLREFPAMRIEPKAKYSSKMTVAVISLNTSPNICIYN